MAPKFRGCGKINVAVKGYHGKIGKIRYYLGGVFVPDMHVSVHNTPQRGGCIIWRQNIGGVER